MDKKEDVVAQVGFPANFTAFRAFVGIVSARRPIAQINVVERGFDADDVNYDDFEDTFPSGSVAVSVTKGL
jgi:hypothetical protein